MSLGRIYSQGVSKLARSHFANQSTYPTLMHVYMSFNPPGGDIHDATLSDFTLPTDPLYEPHTINPANINWLQIGSDSQAEGDFMGSFAFSSDYAGQVMAGVLLCNSAEDTLYISVDFTNPWTVPVDGAILVVTVSGIYYGNAFYGGVVQYW